MVILVPALFMFLGALVYAFVPKAAQLGLCLFLAGALVLCASLAHVPVRIG
jgi:hypothetical protein